MFFATVRSTWFIALLLLGAGLALRLMAMGTFYMDPDEAWHVLIAAQPTAWQVITYNFADNAHPPFYYLILYSLLQLTQQVELLRLSALIPWLGWTFLCWRIGAHIGGRRMGIFWLACACLLSAPFTLSLALREYMWMALCLTAQFYLFLQLREHATPRRWMAYTLCGIAAIGFDYSAVFAIAITGLLLMKPSSGLQAFSWPKFLEATLIHLGLAGWFALLYSQHAFIHLDASLWNPWYYYDYSPSNTVLQNYFTRLLSIAIADKAIALPIRLLSPLIAGFILVFGLRGLARSAPSVFYYSAACLLTVLLLAVAKIYPMEDARRLSWALPAVIAVFTSAVSRLPTQRIGVALGVCGLGGYLAWQNFQHFKLLGALPTHEFRQLETTLATIPTGARILTDIQTTMLLQPWHGWTELRQGVPGFSQLEWRGHRLDFPAWSKFDLYDPVARQHLGGIRLDATTIKAYAAQENHADVWLVKSGLTLNADQACTDALKRLGDIKLILQGRDFIARFSAEDYRLFAEACPPNPKHF